MHKLVILGAILLALLHHDFWWWKSTELIFGFLPIGLAWHALYSILASWLALFAIKYAWPLDEEESNNEGANS